MIARLAPVFGIMAFGLAGCGAAPLAQAALARLSGVNSAPAAVQAPKVGPAIMVTLASRGVKFQMRPLKRDGNVTLWAAGDFSQLAMRDGILISTRGFGMDLMSADVPTVADLVGGAAMHKRTHHYLDGADSPIRRDYDCTTEPVAEDGPKTVAHHIREVCQSHIGRITNEYWIDSGLHVVKSRQWVSQGVGYATIEASAG